MPVALGRIGGIRLREKKRARCSAGSRSARWTIVSSASSPLRLGWSLGELRPLLLPWRQSTLTSMCILRDFTRLRHGDMYYWLKLSGRSKISAAFVLSHTFTACSGNSQHTLSLSAFCRPLAPGGNHDTHPGALFVQTRTRVAITITAGGAPRDSVY